MDFRRVSFGIEIKQLSELTGLHPSTLRRYRRSNKAPRHIIELIAIYRAGKLPSQEKTWDGWKIIGECLADPDGNTYHVNEIRQLPYLFQLQKEFQKYRRAPAQFLLDV